MWFDLEFDDGRVVLCCGREFTWPWDLFWVCDSFWLSWFDLELMKGIWDVIYVGSVFMSGFWDRNVKFMSTKVICWQVMWFIDMFENLWQVGNVVTLRFELDVRFESGTWFWELIAMFVFWISQLSHRSDRIEREPAELNASKPKYSEFRKSF